MPYSIIIIKIAFVRVPVAVAAEAGPVRPHEAPLGREVVEADPGVLRPEQRLEEGGLLGRGHGGEAAAAAALAQVAGLGPGHRRGDQLVAAASEMVGARGADPRAGAASIGTACFSRYASSCAFDSCTSTPCWTPRSPPCRTCSCS